MSATELDDLKAAWQVLNRNLERQHTLALHQFREGRVSRFRSGLRPLALGQVIQLICGAILAGLSAQFAAKHLSSAHLVSYAVELAAYGIMLAAFAVRDLGLIHGIDYGAPVVVLQKQIASLRAWHLRAGMWLAVAGCIVWLPLILLVPHYVGLDILPTTPNAISWLVLNCVVCLGLAGAAIYLFRRGKGGLANALRNSAVGRSVQEAEAALDELVRFETE